MPPRRVSNLTANDGLNDGSELNDEGNGSGNVNDGGDGGDGPVPSFNEHPSNAENDIKPTEWDDSFETICGNLVDEAQINTFLHLKSHRYYSKWSRVFQIPIILLSALVGSANFASDNFGNQKENVILIVGGVSILISIISSIAQYLKLAELKEGHRISSFHWEKFFNKLKVQLMLKKDARRRLPDFYDDMISEYHRLKEISPIFERKIALSARKNKGYEHLTVPFYLNGFRPIIPYEKAQEDYQYYFLTNNTDKLVKGITKIPPKKSQQQLQDDGTEQQNSSQQTHTPVRLPATDVGIIDSNFWNDDDTSA